MSKVRLEKQAPANEINTAAEGNMPDWLAIYRLPVETRASTNDVTVVQTPQTGQGSDLAGLGFAWLNAPLDASNPSYMLAQQMFYKGDNPDYRVGKVGEFPVVAMTPPVVPPPVEPAVKQPLGALLKAETSKPAAKVDSPKSVNAELSAEEIAQRRKNYKPRIVDGERKINVENPEYHDGARPQAMAAPDTESFRKLQNVVDKMIGHKMREYEPWFNTVKRMEDGCAAFVSEVLQRRYGINGDWRVEELEDSVVNSGKFVKVKLEDAQPGDVIIGHRRPWHDGKPRYGHSAIMWTDGQIVNNNSLHPGCPQIDVQPTDKFYIVDEWDGKPMFKSVVAYHYVGDQQYAARQAKKRQQSG